MDKHCNNKRKSKAVDNNDDTAKQEGSSNANVDNEEDHDFGFNAGFQAQLQKEGGGTNLKVYQTSGRSNEIQSSWKRY
jgi:hypothetical protein